MRLLSAIQLVFKANIPLQDGIVATQILKAKKAERIEKKV